MINVWEVEVLQVLLVGQVKEQLEDVSDLSYNPFETDELWLTWRLWLKRN